MPTPFQIQKEEEERKRREQEAKQLAKAPAKQASAPKQPKLTRRSDGKTYVNLNDLTDESAASLARRMKTDEARDAFLTQYVSHVGRKTSANYRADAPTLDAMRGLVDSGSGGAVYASTKSAIKQTSAAFDGMIDVTGKTVNMNTADLNTVIRAIRATADDTLRKSRAKAFETLTKTQGSRFYGAAVDTAQLKTFLDSAQLTAADYKAYIEDFAAVFSPQPGKGAENREAYGKLRTQIEALEDGYLRQTYLYALDQAYRSQTASDTLPDMAVFAKEQEAAAQEAAKEQDGEGNWLTRLIEELTQTGADKAAAYVKETKAQKQAAQEAALPEPYPTPDASRSAGEWQGPVQQKQEGELIDEIVRKYGEPTQESEPVGTVDLTGDPIAAVRYAQAGKGGMLTQETQQEVNALFASSPAVRVILGFDPTQVEGWTSEEKLALYSKHQTDALTGGYSGVLGSTLGGYLTRGKLDSFPEELRDDLEGAIMQIALDAEEAYRNGEIGYDPRLTTLYDAYIRSDLGKGALEQVRGVFSTVDGLKREKEEAARLSALQEEKTQEELYAQSVAAVQTGSYTQEDWDRVMAQAKPLGVFDTFGDDAYNGLVKEINAIEDEALWDETGWLYEQAQDYVRRMGIGEDMARDEAQGYAMTIASMAHDVIRNDLWLAKTLDMKDLATLYGKWGGMSAAQVYDRALAEYQKIGETTTEEEVEELSQLGMYMGTGTEVTTVEAVVEGGKHGFYQAGGDILEGIWATAAINKEDAPTYVRNVRSKFIDKYGFGAAAHMYDQYMRVYAENAPSKEQGEAIIAYLDSGRNVFGLGIDPLENDIVMALAKEADRRAEAIAAWAQRSLAPGQGRWFETASATTGTFTMQAAASLATKATMNPFIGTYIGYGFASGAQEMREQLAAGASRKDALVMGEIHAVTDAIANVYMSDNLTDNIFRAFGFDDVVRMGAQAAGTKGTVNATKGMMALAKKMGIEAVKQSAGETLVDPFMETLLWESGKAAGEARLSGATVFQTIAAGLSAVDPIEAGRETISQIPQNFIYTLPLSLLSGVSAGFGELHMPKTKSALTSLTASGSAEDAQAVAQAAAEELGDPATRKAFDQAMEQTQIAQAAAGAMMTDPEIGAQIDEAAEDQRQADAHRESRDASAAQVKAGFQNAAAALDDIDAGDTSPEAVGRVADGMDAVAKGKQGEAEHERARKAKQDAADKGFTQAMYAATDKARAQVQAQQRAATGQKPPKAATPEDSESAKRQERMAQIKARMDEIGAIYEANPELEDPALDEESEQLASEYGALQEAQEAANERSKRPEFRQTAVTGEDTQGERAVAPMPEGMDEDAPLFESERQPRKKQTEAYADDAEFFETLSEDAPQSGETEEARYQRQEYARQEMEAMQPVFRWLQATGVYVNDSQKANILHATGLKTLQQVNFRYGFKLTNDAGKGAMPLDGHFFTQLAEESGGRIDADATHPEDALIEIGETKKRLRKDMQASVGETIHEIYVEDEGAYYGTKDPVTQQLASDFYKSTGLTVTVAPLANQVRALYDRANGRVILSNRIGAGLAQAQAAMHELTHYIEESSGYEAYKKAVLEAAYFGDTDGVMQGADAEQIRDTYAQSGIVLDEAGVESELVAQATEKIITDESGEIVRRLLGQERRGLLVRLKNMLVQFLARRKAKREGRLAQYDAIENAYKRLRQALSERGKWAQGETGTDVTVDLDTQKRHQGEVAHDAMGEQMQYALVQDESGWPMVKADRDFRLSDNPKEWGKQIRKYIRDEIRKHGVLRIKTLDGAEIILDKNSQEKARDWIVGADFSQNRAKMNAAAHLDEVVEVSEDANPGASNTPDEKGIHKFAEDGWRYREAVFEDYDGKRYLLAMSVGQSRNGQTVYSIGDVAEIEKRTLAPVNGQLGRVPSDRAEIASNPALRREDPSSDTIVPEGTTDVNPQSTQNGVQYALAPNQFGNETAQRMTTISQTVKDLLAGSEHEVVTNQAQLDAAWEKVNADGLDATAANLLAKGDWDAQDNAAAGLCMVLASQRGDETTAAAIAMRLDTEGTKQGQALQVRQMFLRLTPEGAMGEMVRKAERINQGAGIPAGSFPTGEGAPKTGGTTTDEKTGTKATTPPNVQDVYDEADSLQEQLDALPGDVSTGNPWGLPLADWQMALIKKFRLTGVKLPGINYNIATKKQRMLSAVIATDPRAGKDAQKALSQQLVAIDKGYAVVTVADLRYTASQIAEFKALEGSDAVVPTTQAGREALGRAFQAQDNTIPAGVLKKWASLRYLNMLSAPATATRNVASNVISGGLETVSTGIATIADRSIAKKTGNRTTSLPTRAERRDANRAFAAEVSRTIYDYFIAHVDTGHGRKYDVGGQGRVFQNEFLEAARNFVDFTMQIGDRPFYEQSYAQELAIVKRLGMKTYEMKDGKRVQRPMTEAEMHAEATVRALHRVYQENSEMAEIVAKLRGMSPTMDLIISTLVPFVKTPTNVAMRAMEYSPVGLANALIRRATSGIDTGALGSISQRDYVMGIGRGLTGTGLLAAGVLLAAAGYLKFGRGEEENKNRREVLTSLYEPYGMYIEIGGQKREIDWALPASAALATGAELVRNLDDGEGFGWALATAIVSGLGDQLMDTPMLSGLSEIFRGYDDTEDMLFRLVKTEITSLMNQTFSPSAIRAVAKATDPYVRDTSSQSEVMSILNGSVVQYWPVFRQMFLPAKTDITGEKMLQSGYYSWGKETQNAALHMLDSFFTPTATIGEKNDEALFELLDLSYRLQKEGESFTLPAALVGENGRLSVTKTLAGKTGTGDAGYIIELTDDQRREANRLYGDLLFNGMRGVSYTMPNGVKKYDASDLTGIRVMMESGEWAALTDKERADRVDEMRAKAKEIVTLMAIRDEL